MSGLAKDPLPLDFTTGKRWYIYLYRDPRPRKGREPIYVGKGTPAHRRADIHWNGQSHNKFLNNVLNKIRKAGLEPIVEVIAGFDIEADAFKCEAALIRRFGRRDLGLGTLCNLTDGGEGTSGRVHTDEARAKMSDAWRTYRTVNEKTVEALVRAARAVNEARKGKSGKPYSLEARARMSESRRGRPGHPFSEVSRLKLIQTKRSQPHWLQLDAIVEQYNSGDSCQIIATRYGISDSTVASMLKSTGITHFRRRRRLVDAW